MQETRQSASPVSPRRTFLKAAGAAAAVGAGTVAMPNVSRAQTVTLKMQGAWGATDIFNDMATEYVDRVNKMAGGRLRIEYLVAGAVVKPFSVMDAVHDGVLDGGHHVTVYWYGKHKAASLFGTGPYFGWNAAQGLAWIHKGGGKELYNELVNDILQLDVVGFFAMPMPTQPLGWFKNKPEGPDDLKGLKYRTVGLAADLFQQMGLSVAQLPGGEILPAMERGVIDAFEFNNPTSDKRFGAQDVAKNYMLGSYHQATEYFEIIFNKTKFASLPAEHQAILEFAAEAASTSNLAMGLDNYSRDLTVLQQEHGVGVHRTAESILAGQLAAWDVLLADLATDPFFAKVLESQKEWVKRVVFYELYNAADQRLAYEHFFGKLDI
ncbi:MAG TPA: TRAP transporter substrate-binding protein [Geminicoccaceae bacterium]|nr:TRAP transporter substrate-binding protein [Geminicoccus sp.]HMU49842.1 TRAP transporter substrate-binding protein [Geminicoccaceae bacterium]